MDPKDNPINQTAAEKKKANIFRHKGWVTGIMLTILLVALIIFELSWSSRVHSSKSYRQAKAKNHTSQHDEGYFQPFEIVLQGPTRHVEEDYTCRYLYWTNDDEEVIFRDKYGSAFVLKGGKWKGNAAPGNVDTFTLFKTGNARLWCKRLAKPEYALESN